MTECKIFAQKLYKQWRHDNLAINIQWDLCDKWKLDHAEKWYDHKPLMMIEDEDVKILWEMKKQTDHMIEHSMPDIVVFERKQRKCIIIDVTCPFDTREAEEENVR